MAGGEAAAGVAATDAVTIGDELKCHHLRYSLKLGEADRH